MCIRDSISDLSKNDLRAIIDGAKKRKSERGKIPNSQPDVDLPIKGKTMIMLFGKPSTRTRISFDLAVKQLGGSSIILNQDEIHYGKGDETIKDTAKVLSQYADILMIRTDSHNDVDEFQKRSKQSFSRCISQFCFQISPLELHSLVCLWNFEASR